MSKKISPSWIASSGSRWDAASARVGALAVAFALMLTASTRADSVFDYTVSFDTTGLAASSGSYALALQFTDPTGDNSSVTVSNFSSGNSTPAGAIQFAYGNTGDLNTAPLFLPGSGSFAALIQTFTPGNTLSFNVSVSTDATFAGPTPNEFNLSIVDPMSFVALNTDDPSMGNSLLTIDTVAGGPPTYTASVATDSNDNTLVTGGTITPTTGAAAPLPSVAGGGLVLLGLVSAYTCYRRLPALPG